MQKTECERTKIWQKNRHTFVLYILIRSGLHVCIFTQMNDTHTQKDKVRGKKKKRNRMYNHLFIKCINTWIKSCWTVDKINAPVHKYIHRHAVRPSVCLSCQKRQHQWNTFARGEIVTTNFEIGTQQIVLNGMNHKYFLCANQNILIKWGKNVIKICVFLWLNAHNILFVNFKQQQTNWFMAFHYLRFNCMRRRCFFHWHCLGFMYFLCKLKKNLIAKCLL